MLPERNMTQVLQIGSYIVYIIIQSKYKEIARSEFTSERLIYLARFQKDCLRFCHLAPGAHFRPARTHYVGLDYVDYCVTLWACLYRRIIIC